MSFLNKNSSSSSADTMDEYWCAKEMVGPLFWAVFATVCFVLGFPASLTVLYVLFQKKQSVFSDIFTLSVTVIDLTLTASVPFSICNYMIWRSMEFEWISDFIFSFTITGRPLFMACICGDCYFAVVHPIAYKTSKKVDVIKKAIFITVWLISTSFSSTAASLIWIFSMPWSSAFIITALFAIVFYNISILRALKKPGPTGKKNIHPQKKRALHIIRVSFIMTFIAYLPPVIMLSFGKLMPVMEIGYNCSLLFIAGCSCMLGCVIMPALYLINVGKLDIIKKWCK